MTKFDPLDVEPSIENTRTFTSSLNALQAVLEKFKNVQLPLEEALSLFEEGVGYVKYCQSMLNQASGSVQNLSEALAQTTSVDERVSA
jgi:exodeoxyribonuclease VII small subunit